MRNLLLETVVDLGEHAGALGHALLQRIVAATKLVLRLADTEQRRDRRRHLLGLGRLNEVGIRAAVQAANAVAHVGEGR
jgi:hypothetical protein